MHHSRARETAQKINHAIALFALNHCNVEFFLEKSFSLNATFTFEMHLRLCCVVLNENREKSMKNGDASFVRILKYSQRYENTEYINKV